LQFVEQADQMLQIPSEPIELPGEHDIESPALRVGHELIERWSSILCSTHSTIYVLDGCPTSIRNVPSQLL